MDIQHLVDRLEDLIDEGRHIFGTKLTMIDEERALEIIDQMRISIPEEIEKSARILAQRDRVLAEAHEEAARIVQQNRQKAESMLDQDATVRQAKVRAEAIKEQAHREAARITAEADQYAMQILSQLEQLLMRDLNEVRNGISLLNAEPEAETESPTAYQPVHVPQSVDEYEQVEVDELVDVDADSAEL